MPADRYQQDHARKMRGRHVRTRLSMMHCAPTLQQECKMYVPVTFEAPDSGYRHLAECRNPSAKA
jgi:hypothetical protein